MIDRPAPPPTSQPTDKAVHGATPRAVALDNAVVRAPALKLPSAAVFANIVVTLVLFLGACGIVPAAMRGDTGSLTAATDQGALGKQAIYFGLFAIGLLLAFVHRTRRPSFPLLCALGVVVGWCWLSLAWSAAPDIGVRRIVVLTIIFITVLTAMCVSPPSNVLRYLPYVFVSLLIANCIAVAVFPAARITTAENDVWASAGGAWRGLHIDKNGAGAFAALGVFFCTFRVFDSTARTWVRCLWAAMALVEMVFVYYSGSKTSFALVPVIFGLAGVSVKMAETGTRRWLVALAFVAVVVVFLIMSPNLVRDARWSIEALGSDPAAFTGRTMIWQVALKYAALHPWLGAGYGSFWVGQFGPLGQFARGWVLDVPHAHNGYLNVLVQIGAIGTVLAVFAAILLPFHLILSRVDLAFPVRWLGASVLWFFVFHNLLESSLFDRDNPVWVILLCVIISITTKPTAKRTVMIAQPRPRDRGR